MKKLELNKYCLIVVYFVFIFSNVQAQIGLWTKAGNMPESRFGHTLDEINGKIYVIGGVIDEGSAYPTHSLVYDRSSGEWSQINLYNNSVRGAHNSCVVDGKLYIVGGNDGIRTIATIEMFDPNTGEWTSKTPMPTDRGLAACATIEGKIYVIGGLRGTLPWNLDWTGVNTVEVYDTKNDTWTKLEDMPSKRWGLSATAVNGKIYIFGGRSTGVPFGSIEVYDPQTNKWTTNSNNMPTPRYCLTTCLINSNIYAIGGWFHSSSGPLYDKVEVYNTVSDEWKVENSLPAKLAVLASIAVDDKIYVYGGARTTHANIGTSEIYEFSYYDIYPKQPNVNKTYARQGIDSILFMTEIANIYNHPISANLYLINSNKTKIDSIRLFDDGLHGDALYNDGIFGGYISPQDNEDFYSLDINIYDKQTDKYIKMSNITAFTTAGPVVVDSISILKGRNYYSIRPFVHNLGNNKIIKNASVKLIIDDPWVHSINPQIIQVPDIPVDSVLGTSSWFNVGCIDSVFPGYFNLKLEILSDNYPYWKDSIKSIVTGVEKNHLEQLEYKLYQNYPNPFNPATKISWQSPVSGRQTLKIFDILGSEIATLIDEVKSAGSYKVIWNAANLPSGVYFYQLKATPIGGQAGSFTATKKLLLLK